MTYQPPPCEICGAWTEVLETRRRHTGAVARRIECANLHRFTVYEGLPVKDEQQPMVTPVEAAPIETTVARAIRLRPALHTIWMN
ncbi:hypothetical protein [Acidovorax sp. FJL06]|uniref:hypothetical protein n=1 Tax=Acidovorax sp. FJL06 TaxID=2153365 RepID=UPI000F566AE6|nr:hypothetical protein [Acidovorax sp. FJL06]RQO83503.1 hypothetical protein DBV10_04045 [Acidovorax sp. FJL06]